MYIFPARSSSDLVRFDFALTISFHKIRLCWRNFVHYLNFYCTKAIVTGWFSQSISVSNYVCTLYQWLNWTQIFKLLIILMFFYAIYGQALTYVFVLSFHFFPLIPPQQGHVDYSNFLVHAVNTIFIIYHKMYYSKPEIIYILYTALWYKRRKENSIFLWEIWPLWQGEGGGVH